MNSLLLSSLTRDFLNRDRETASPRELYHLGWAGSTLSSYSNAELPAEKKNLAFGALLRSFKEKFASLLNEPTTHSVSLSTAPRLSKPKPRPAGSYRPSRYFSRGAIDQDTRKNPEPISFLLTETQETAKARPVPGNIPLIRSLCKGKGTLCRNKQGLIYLDIDNRFISTLLPYLKLYGLIRPPYFNLFAEPHGAHIPVIPAREANFHYLTEIEEVEREFSFEIEGLYSMEPVSWPEVEQVWFFKLRSPQLEKIRRHHFLPALPNGHPFHIAVAVKPRITATEERQPLPLMRVNIACSPV